MYWIAPAYERLSHQNQPGVLILLAMRDVELRSRPLCLECTAECRCCPSYAHFFVGSMPIKSRVMIHAVATPLALNPLTPTLGLAV